jgi:CheY-like chemotaxis protein
VSHHVLIVDPNEAFATMLEQSLEDTGEYDATAVYSGRDALRTITTGKYDLAIVDIGVEDVEGPLLVRRLREDHPQLRIMIIPLDGDQVPDELSDMQLQGTLPKPFFLPELPERVGTAFSAPLEVEPEEEEEVEEEVEADEEVEEVEEVPDAEPPTAVTWDELPDLTPHMNQLFQEVRAQCVLLSQGEELLCEVSQLAAAEVSALAAVARESWQTSARVAQILGKEQLRFEQSLEGDEHLLYSLALTRDLILSVVVEGRMPLGIIRHRAKETAEKIRGLMGIAP